MLDDDLARKAQRVFETIVNLSREEREEAVAKLPLGLREEIEALLAAVPPTDQSSVTPREPSVHRVSVGPYRLIKCLGQGGVGTVYLAEHMDGLPERQFAVKVLNRIASFSDHGERFRREVNALGKLSHKNIVRFFSADCTEDGSYYLVMEYIEGAPLVEYCDQRSLDIAARIELFAKVCEAVSHAHQNAIAHRDLKPPNILVQSDGEPKLLDFGVAKPLEEQSGRYLTTNLPAPFTLSYASPEQIRGERNIGIASDIYSLGTILYELLIGTHPFEERSVARMELERRILHDAPVFPSGRRALVSGALLAIILRALQKDPSKRYLSVDNLVADLSAASAGQPISAHREKVASRLRAFIQSSRSFARFAGVAVAVSVILAGLYLLQQHREHVHYKAVVDLANVALAAQGSGPVEKTLRFLRLSANHLEEIAHNRPDDEFVKGLLVDVYSTMAFYSGHPTMRNIGSTNESIQLLEKATLMAGEIYGKHPNDPEWRMKYSQMLCGLGTVLIEANRYDEALRNFRAAADVTEETSNNSPTDRQLTLYHADAIGNISRVRLHESDVAETLRLRDLSVAIRRRVVEKEPGNLGYLFHLAAALSTRGWALREFGRVREAERDYLEADEYLNRILNEDSALTNVENLRATNYEQISRVFLLSGQPHTAVKWAVRGVDELRVLQGRDPHSNSIRRSLALVLSVLAQAEAQIGNSQYREHIAEAMNLSLGAVSADSTNEKVKDENQQIRAVSNSLLAPSARTKVLYRKAVAD